MPTSKIFFEGISRIPSSRASKDGECEESLNMMLEGGELIAAPKPIDASEELKLPENGEGIIKYIYIHKQPAYTNYICIKGSFDIQQSTLVYEIGAYVLDDSTDTERTYHKLFEITSADSFESITSVGNTLIVSIGEDMHYSLFDGEEYKYLGTDIPDFSPGIMPVAEVSADTKSEAFTFLAAYTAVNKWFSLVQRQGPQDVSGDTKLEGFLDKLREMMSAVVSPFVKKGRVVFPYFFRIATRLYDGSLVNATPLIFVANAGEITSRTYSYLSDTYKFYDDSGFPNFWVGKYYDEEIFFGMGGVGNSPSQPLPEVNVPTSKIDIELSNLRAARQWSDIVKSVDIFCSGPIYPNIQKNVISAGDYHTDDGYQASQVQFFGKAKDTVSAKEYLETAAGPLFLVKSIDIANIEGGTYFEELKEDLSLETLATHETLAESVSHRVTLGKLSQLNGRVIGSLENQILSKGYKWVNACGKSSGTILSGNNRHWSIETNSGQKYVSTNISGISLGFEEYGFISYLDARCKECVLGNKYTVVMQPLPGTDCAYGFWGFNKKVSDVITAIPVTPPAEDRIEAINNKIALSESSNPFFYPATLRYTIDASKILGFATTTIALSTGQFGQFPLYVFTNNGIFALSMNETGSFSAAHPLSRDVAIEGTICPIDQAIVFVTNKGVMMLAGSQIECISEVMNGKVSALDELSQCYGLIADWGSDIDPDYFETHVADALLDGTTFLNFVKTAKAVYDYAGQRLVFIPGNAAQRRYCYVYSLPTKTWHKMSLNGTSLHAEEVSVLNGYPDALVSFSGIDDDDTFFANIFNLSSFRSEGQEVLEGIAITRPINFGSPDVFKTITELKIRKDIDTGSSVKYILLGSNDRRNFGVLSSLRGKSYKFFKIVLLGDIRPYDRIAYAEVMWEERFSNKLR